MIQDVLTGWDLWAADPPGTLRPWAAGDVLPSGVHDIWCRPAADRPWALQVMLDESDGDLWISRRDQSVRCPIAQLGLRSADGIPYLSPEIQLYYKAGGLRPKDVVDFDAVLPLLGPVQRDRLSAMIAGAHGRAHPWYQRLRDDGP